VRNIEMYIKTAEETKKTEKNTEKEKKKSLCTSMSVLLIVVEC
jgi:hypothetical protein